jgi:predicted nucleic acid-binding Zn ribbon protein
VEKIQKFSAPAQGICKKCGGTLERLLSSSAIQFKGSGWYVTDYARKSSTAPASEASANKSDTSTDTKKATEPAPSKPAAESK